MLRHEPESAHLEPQNIVVVFVPNQLLYDVIGVVMSDRDPELIGYVQVCGRKSPEHDHVYGK